MDSALRQIRDRLPRTWGALLARHGRLTPVQQEAIPSLLSGRDVLLCAPTASGKTEAYLAPMVERHLGEARGEGPARLLVICPTRALANDLHRRIQGALHRAEVPAGRWTGDARDGGRLRPLTLLTPEALDGRLSRDPRALAHVTGVVLDEVHVLDGTARGDQLRVLVERLRRGRPLQAAAASATVPEPHLLARRYLRDPAVVAPGLRRPLAARVVEGGRRMLPAVLDQEVARGFRKILVFVNRREDVESATRKLRGRPPFGDAVFPHHGSISRVRRRRVERAFLERPAALCVATSTLELGIDIGDIDLVVVVGIPPDVASLVQRAGRGGRRSRASPVVAIVRGPMERQVLRVMFEAQARGDLLAAPYAFRAGVLVQQAASILHENPGRWISAEAIRSRLPVDLREAWPHERLEAILDAATRAGWLERSGTRWILGEKGEQEWSRGGLHANLEPRRDVEVRDFLTGEPLGNVARMEGGRLGLSGEGMEVLRQEGRRAVVREGGSQPAPTHFDTRPPPPLSPRLAHAVLQALGIPVPARMALDGHALFHGLGSAGGSLLGAVFRAHGAGVIRTGPLAVLLDGLPSPWPPPEAVGQAIRAAEGPLGRALAMGRFHEVLPRDERVRVLEALLDTGAVARWLAAGPPPWVEEPDPNLARAAARW